MNFFQQQLKWILGNQPEFQDAKYVGRACFVPLVDGTRIKAELITRGTHEKYEALKLTAMNKAEGQIDATILEFKFCISLQNTLSGDLTQILAGQQSAGLAGTSTSVLEGSFAVATQTTFGLLNLLCMIAFAYCVIKIFFANIKRGGILLIQIAVGSLYMFSVPRGFTDGFNQWCKQVIAICLTAFMQTTLLFLGLLTFPGNMLLGLGIMLAANEVPRIAQQFGLDSSVRVNMMSVVHATTTAVNLTRSVARAAK